MECIFCKNQNTTQTGEDPFVVYEFIHSLLRVGQHQMCSGYCVLVLKTHETELHALSNALQNAFHQELMQAGRAIFQAFQPQKMNYASYGNMAPHLHWHIIPRFIQDPVWPKPLWASMEQFEKYSTTPEVAKAVASRIRAYLP